MVATADHQWSLGPLNYSELQDGSHFRNYQKFANLSGKLAWKDCVRDPNQLLNISIHGFSPDIKQKVTNQCLQVFDRRKNTSFFIKEFSKRDLQISIHKPHDVRPSRKDANAINGMTYQNNDEARSFRALLKSCARSKDLFGGIRVHEEIRMKGFVERCSDALIAMYAKCDALMEAKELLDAHKSRNVSSWTELIAGYVRKGQSEDALLCYECMQGKGILPNAKTLVCILKACGSMKAIEKGKQIHDEVVRQGLFESNVVLGTSLIDMYSKCGALEKAHCVLREMPLRNAVSWSVLITRYAQLGLAEQALACYKSMQDEGLPPDAITFASVLKACGMQGALVTGEQIHDEIFKQGLLDSDFVLGTALVDMYAKCGALTKAEEVLEELSCKDVGTWNALIAGYIQHGQDEEALKCFEKMERDGFIPDLVSFALALKACGLSGVAGRGELLEVEIRRKGLICSSDNALCPSIMDMYIQCGDLVKARRVLEELSSRSILSWNLLISGYTRYDQSLEAVRCYESLLSTKGVFPDAITFICTLKACGVIKALQKGKQIHHKISKQGLLQKNIVLGNALVDFYVKCGALSDAHRVLEELPFRDIVTWSTLIAGYSEQGQGEKALSCFDNMQREGLSPNAVTYACILKACGSMGAVEKGEQFHEKIAKEGLLGKDGVLDNCLLDMYVKCGALGKAKEVLDKISSRDASALNTIIAGYAQQGQTELALKCLEQMECEGCPPNTATFSCLLSACSHLGLIEDCQTYFGIMSIRYGVKAGVEHYTAMVDLLGRAGHLEKAIEVIQGMPSADCIAVWRVLLTACKEWQNATVGKWAFRQLVRLENSDASGYTLMANMHARDG